VGLATSTVLKWIHAAGVPIRLSPRFQRNVVVPESSSWKFIEHKGKDSRRANQRVAIFECTCHLADGSVCGMQRTLVINTVTSGRTQKCHSCAARLRPRKKLQHCGYEWKRKRGVASAEDRKM